jgi:hypothetical protein
MLDKLQPLIVLLAVLAVPVLLIAAYDKWILAPKRPRTPEGEVAPGPLYVRVADLLLPFVLVALVLKIGVSEVFGWAKDIAIPLSWFAAPIGLWCAIDSWIFAPRRQIKMGGHDIKDPPVLRAAYTLLPVLVVAVIIRLISAETLDFTPLLVPAFEEGYDSNLRKEDFALAALPRVDVYRGLVFASMSPAGITLDEHLGALPGQPHGGDDFFFRCCEDVGHLGRYEVPGQFLQRLICR